MPKHTRVQIGQAAKPNKKEEEYQKDRDSPIDVGSTIMQKKLQEYWNNMQ